LDGLKESVLKYTWRGLTSETTCLTPKTQEFISMIKHLKNVLALASKRGRISHHFFSFGLRNHFNQLTMFSQQMDDMKLKNNQKEHNWIG
jgi:hypothetical protein